MEIEKENKFLNNLKIIKIYKNCKILNILKTEIIKYLKCKTIMNYKNLLIY